MRRIKKKKESKQMKNKKKEAMMRRLAMKKEESRIKTDHEKETKERSMKEIRNQETTRKRWRRTEKKAE